MLLAAEPAPVTIHSHTPPPAIAAASWQASRSRAAHAAAGPGCTRQSGQPAAGPYLPQTEYSRYWQQWRKVAVVAGALLVVAFAQRGVQLYQLTEQDKALKAEIRQVYTRIFPGRAASSTCAVR